MNIYSDKEAFNMFNMWNGVWKRLDTGQNWRDLRGLHSCRRCYRYQYEDSQKTVDITRRWWPYEHFLIAKRSTHCFLIKALKWKVLVLPEILRSLIPRPRWPSRWLSCSRHSVGFTSSRDRVVNRIVDEEVSSVSTEISHIKIEGVCLKLG